MKRSAAGRHRGSPGFRLRLLVATVLLLAATPLQVRDASAQVRAGVGGTGSLVGTVLDAQSGQPLAGTLVSLRTAGDSANIAGTLTNATGTFRFEGLVPGEYDLAFRQIGYADLVRDVRVTAGGSIEVGQVLLTPAALALEGVSVVAEPSPVVHAADRDIYSVEAIASAAGGTAIDALSELPELEVDIEGGVSMRGASPAIYINGRPAPMRGESLDIFLQQFPADAIESIEVISEPSSRFDAEGAGGVINIVLKRNASLGLNGSAFVNGETRGNVGSGARVTFQRGPLTLMTGANVRLSRNETHSRDLRQNLRVDPATYLEQDGFSERSGQSGNLDFTAEYALGENTSITSEFGFRGNSSDSDRLTTYTEMDSDWEIQDRYDRLSISDSDGLSGNFAFEFEHAFEPRSHELTIELDYDRNSNDRGSFSRRRTNGNDQLEDGLGFQLIDEDRNGLDSELAMRIDYTRPWREMGQLEIGARGTFSASDDARIRRTGLEGLPEEELDVEDMGFNQRQAIGSVYLTARRRFGDFNAQLGLRAEHTDLEFEVPDTSAVFGNSYTSLFPNASIAYQIDESKRLRLSYSTRVRRPGANVLNPINTSTDPFERRIGNPEIDPQYTHSVSFDASWSGSFGSLRVSPFLRKSVDEWEQYTEVDTEGVATRKWANLGESTSYGASLSAAVRDYHGFGGSVSLNTQRYDRHWDAIVGRSSTSSLRWSLRTNLNARVTESLNVRASIRYNPPRDLAQGRTSSTTMTTLGFRQRLLDNRLSLNVNVTDPFDLYRSTSQTSSESYIELNTSRQSMRRASFSLSYNFGGYRGGQRGGGGRGGPAGIR